MARVESSGKTVKIVTPDLRDNRGWSTVTLTLGERVNSAVSGIQEKVRTSVVGSVYKVEVTTIRAGREVGYTLDQYSFTERGPEDPGPVNALAILIVLQKFQNKKLQSLFH